MNRGFKSAVAGGHMLTSKAYDCLAYRHLQIEPERS